MQGITTQLSIDTGHLVEFQGAPGVGRIGDANGRQVRVDWFESIANPVVESEWMDVQTCFRVHLMVQTRVYHHDPDTGVWRVGRVKAGGPDLYYVQFPNDDAETVVNEADLRVRWDRPIADPKDVLVVGANESPYFLNARMPMLKATTAQRAACCSVPAMLSAGVEIYPHQIDAALTVLSDPVQRYLLADEVGLGKTVEAGFVIRQVLLDDPRCRVAVVVPDVLRRQWQQELRERFFIDDFPSAAIAITRHETPDRWREYHGSDLVVVDEAHLLAVVTGPDDGAYRSLRLLAHTAKRLLLLSATPFTANSATQLALLHLLDPALYRWDRREEFERKVQLRKELASSIYGLDADFEVMLRGVINEISALLPRDSQFESLAADITSLLTADSELADETMRSELSVRVAALRAHISETYRLHRRVIRHRRADVLGETTDPDLAPFDVTGREKPEWIHLEGSEVADDLILRWQLLVSAWMVDNGEEALAEGFGMALAVLVSRADWELHDLSDALRWRVLHDAEAADRAKLTPEEQHWLSVPPLVAGEQHLVADIEIGSNRGAFGRVLERIARQYRRILVCCGPGGLAEKLARQITTCAGKAVLVHTAQVGGSGCDEAVAKWRAQGGALLVDGTAEDGLNLQSADAVVHCRFPWSPNRLEQRIGRVDRYRPPSERRGTARQFVVVGDVDGLPAAWLNVLVYAVGIWARSISSLQDAVDRAVPCWWAIAVLHGPEGFAGLHDQIASTLDEERKHVQAMDMLESVHESAPARQVAEQMGHLESRWQNHRAALLGYAGDRPGGLRFTVHDPNGRITTFERGDADLLMPPRMFAGQHRLSPAVMTGTFNRTVALNTAGTRLFRLGNPFVDTLTNTVGIDDRGQAVAFRRIPPDAHDEHAVFIGFDYLVEVDINRALQLSSETVHRHALRRQADRMLAPVIRRVWLPAGSADGVDDPDQLSWLNQPYDPRIGDVNLSSPRHRELTDFFGGTAGFRDALYRADIAGRNELARLTDLERRQNAALAMGRSTLAVQRVQAKARQAAGAIVTDTECLATDVRLAEALLDGVAAPAVHTVAVICVLRARTVGRAE